MPACCAAAGVGQNVLHQRLRSRASRTGARARAARAWRAGSTFASAIVLAGAWMASEASIPSASASSAGANASRWWSCAAAHHVSSWPGSAVRSSGHAPRPSSSRWIASSSGAASVVEETATCWPGCASRQ